MARKTKLVVVNTETPDDGKIIAQEWGGLVPIADLKLHSENAREGDVGAIYQSIAAVKFYGALLVQRSTNTVIVGNHRLKAAHEHGIEALPVIWLDVDDQTARKILVGDNRHADLASWNQIGLAELLQSIQTDTGTLLGTGFDEEALQNLLADLAQSTTGTDESAYIKNVLQVLIECESESQQRELLERLNAEGFKCRALIC